MGIIFGYQKAVGFEHQDEFRDNFIQRVSSFHAGEISTHEISGGIIGYFSGTRRKNSNFYKDNSAILLYEGRIDNSMDVLANSGKNLIKLIEASPESLRGDFSLVYIPKRDNKIRLFRDQLGVIPLYYSYQQKRLFFSNSLELFRLFPELSLDLDQEWVADSLAMISTEVSRTPYCHIHKVKPGSYVKIGDEGIIERRYWDFIEESYQENNFMEVFLEKLRLSVDRRIKDYNTTGNELSGGLDSSAVTVLTNERSNASGKSSFTFSHRLDENALGIVFPYGDERDFADSLISRLSNNSHVNITSGGSGILQSIKDNILIQGGPTQAGFHILSDRLYKIASQHGIEVLLSGFGGDEGITGNCSGLKEELIAQRKWNAYKDYYLGNSYKDYIKFYITRFLPLSREILATKKIYNHKYKEKFSVLATDNSFIQSMQLDKKYRSQKTIQKPASLNEGIRKNLMRSSLSKRLEYSYHAAAHFGIEYSYPLLDIDLIHYYMSLPWNYRTNPNSDRYLMREVMKGLLPDKIRTRNDKTGSTIPYTLLRISNDHSALKDLILRSKEKNKFHFLDYSRMLDWQIEIENYKGPTCSPVNPVAFINSIQILLLQEMEREGEYRTGIWV